MKQAKQCPKCQSVRVGFLATVPDAESVIEVDGQAVEQTIHRGKRAVGRGAELDSGFWKAGRVVPLIGTLEAYVCTSCGYYETYVTDPASVDWPAISDFRWVNAEAGDEGPYR